MDAHATEAPGTMNNGICVIIAAKNAAPTIGRAVSSALRERETSEVVVIDDGSTDDTGAAALAAADSSGRLQVHRFDQNRGPSAARNHAIDVSRAPILAVLDADDFLLPGRFSRLLAEDDWDFIADNIAFVDQSSASRVLEIPELEPRPYLLTLEDFVSGNISRRGVRRGEIGFLKPLMRREFLDRHALRYQEQLRLGEDYDLYARALAQGARYKVIHSCGYGAVVRGDSLSGSHGTDDLKRLYEADRALLSQSGLSPRARSLIRSHERHIRARYELRHFLDLKRQAGFRQALAYVATNPAAFPAIAGGIFNDKTARFRRSVPATPETGGVRYLLAAPSRSG